MGLTWPLLEKMIEAIAKRQDAARTAMLKGIMLAFHDPDKLEQLTKPQTRTSMKQAGFAAKPWWDPAAE